MKAADFIRVFFRRGLIPHLGKLVTISQFSPMRFDSFEPELVFRSGYGLFLLKCASRRKKARDWKTMDAYQSFEGIQHADM